MDDSKFSNIHRMDEPPKSLLDIGERKYYRKGKNIIFSADNYVDGIYYILRGKVAYLQYAENGQEKTFCIAGVSTIFGEPLLFTPAPCNFIVKVLEDTELLFIRRNKIFHLIKTDIDVSLYICTSLSKKATDLTIQTKENLFYDAETRICNLFLQLAENYGIEEGNVMKINMKINQPRISSIVGVTRVTTVRTVKKLKELNLLELDNGYYIIKDLKSLKTYMNNLNLDKEIRNTEQ